MFLKAEEVLLPLCYLNWLPSSNFHHRRWVNQVKIATVCLILSFSGNPDHRRPLPSNKEPHNEASVCLSRRPWTASPRLQLLTWASPPVLTCIKEELMTEDGPTYSFTRRHPQSAAGFTGRRNAVHPSSTFSGLFHVSGSMWRFSVFSTVKSN